MGQFIGRRLRDWHVPGVAVGIVEQDRLIFAKGYGFRDVNGSLPVTDTTLFCINSLSKAFTATAVGILVDDGKLEWDKPIRNYVPSFKMYDPVATEGTTVRDLLTHRTGLPPHYCAFFSSAGIIHEIADLWLVRTRSVV